MKEQNDGKFKLLKDEKNFIVSILILILLIIIVFLLVTHFEFIYHRPQIPTGNVDIFDIIFENDCSYCNSDTPVMGFEVFDEDKTYSQETKLNIFTKASYYVAENKIAPGLSNSYQFVIKNNNNFNLKYSLEFIEDNQYQLNMKYRLKLNNQYVVGGDNEWVTFETLNQYNLNLAQKTYDIYTLDWKWFEGNNDTKIGTDINAKYNLKIKINTSI